MRRFDPDAPYLYVRNTRLGGYDVIFRGGRPSPAFDGDDYFPALVCHCSDKEWAALIVDLLNQGEQR